MWIRVVLFPRFLPPVSCEKETALSARVERVHTAAEPVDGGSYRHQRRRACVPWLPPKKILRCNHRCCASSVRCPATNTRRVSSAEPTRQPRRATSRCEAHGRREIQDTTRCCVLRRCLIWTCNPSRRCCKYQRCGVHARAKPVSPFIRSPCPASRDLKRIPPPCN